MTTHLPLPSSLPPDAIVYSMSKSGYCVRAMVASQFEMPERRSLKTQDLLERSADEGRLHEQAIKDRLREQGYEVDREQDEFIIPIIPGVWLVGHGDGFVSQVPSDYLKRWDLLECKSMSSAQFSKWTRGGFLYFPGYAAQVTSYMKANPGFRVRYEVKRREDGLMSTTFIESDAPPLDFKDIRKKIVTAEIFRRKGEYPPCDLDKSARFFCPFWYLHEEEEEGGDDDDLPLSEEAEVALAELVAVYVDLKARESEGEAAAKERKEGGINEGILNLLGNRQKVKVVIGDRTFEITRRAGGGGMKLDVDALRAEEPDIAARYEKKSPRFEFPVVRELEK